MTGARDAAWGRPIAPLRWWQWCGGLLVAAVAGRVLWRAVRVWWWLPI